MKYLWLLIIAVVMLSCSQESTKPKPGPWRAVLQLDDEKEIPFLLEYKEDSTFVVINAEERIDIKDVSFKGDSIFISHPVFEGVIEGRFTQDSIIGNFIQENLDRQVPIVITHGRQARFNVNAAPSSIVTGNWETVFSPNNATDKYVAKGVFEQKGNRVTGTFLTTTGDYRYLDGVIEDDSLKLSTFDGAHAFLFEAKVTQNDSMLQGMFYSGNHWKEPFKAKRNNDYQLPKADSLTFLKKGYDSLAFSFPNVKGDTISLKDKRFKNKVVIVQIMGTWCPNCLDETRYLTNYYDDKPENVEIVSLAFEYAPSKEKAWQSITKFQQGVGVPYPILLAQYGSNNKQTANDKLPMLNTILSYPTTIFIDKTGNVRKIHTGFSGPATGDKYEVFKKEFESFTEMLANE
ncbi:TlpA family protein disulfide reductase [Marixanthomonas sp. SCSIO 43207]|uniref:TlpA family protein disulfide reductase n=1 Tax=Marixanthomonas sp. SCSIO 43207 TaxID=2779360 RepID=UPI001CAA21F1|nr:TlpA disulfide reductase family protein [Marixanthomonas sp. SCSIO 43207]UAB80295.1 TlpA family protein disulfide reductase [Marixanthomonas sp. SCSIO 43207]